jgi:phosphopantetheine adenylyltransferase
MEDKNMVGIFSGRFDPPHIGHLMTIIDLCKRFQKIVIVVLDYSGRQDCSASMAVLIFETLFEDFLPQICANKIECVVNHTHMAEISVEEYEDLLESVGATRANSIYLSGNPEVLDHMEEIGIKSECVPRSIDHIYSSTIVRSKINVDSEPK